MNILIRQEKESDKEAVYKVNALAFGQENEARLVDLLRDNEAFVPELSLVAISGPELVGHILFSKIKIIGEDGHEHDSLALAPMAVTPAFQHKGIGGQLIKTGLARATALQYTSVIVLGHEHYYPKFGFKPAINWNIKPPFDVPENAFMAIELASNRLKHVSGIVKYAAPFQLV